MALTRAERMAFRKAALLEQQQFLEAVEEIVARGIVLPPPQRVGRHRIGAGRAAEAEIDAARKQAFQHLVAFGDLQRRVVRQHHAAGADPQCSVTAAICPIMMSGAELAMLGRLWCSATQ